MSFSRKRGMTDIHGSFLHFSLYVYVYNYEHTHIFSLREQQLCRFFKAARLTYNYNIYPILKMPSNGLPVWFTGMVKVPISRRFGTKNSNPQYQFLDNLCFSLQFVFFGKTAFLKVPISRSCLHKMLALGGVSEDR